MTALKWCVGFVLGIGLAWLSVQPQDIESSRENTVVSEDQSLQDLQRSNSEPLQVAPLPDIAAPVTRAQPTYELTQEAETQLVVNNQDDYMSPDDPVYKESQRVVNLGSTIDPMDESQWSKHSGDAVRNIGVVLDPDD